MESVTVLPFDDLHEPIATLLRHAHRGGRRSIEKLLAERRHMLRLKCFAPNVARVRTPSGVVMVSIMPDGGRLHARLEITRFVQHMQRDLLVHTAHLPETVLVAAVGRTLRDIIDMGIVFPARDAVIIAGDVVGRSTRLTLDVRPDTLRLNEIPA